MVIQSIHKFASHFLLVPHRLLDELRRKIRVPLLTAVELRRRPFFDPRVFLVVVVEDANDRLEEIRDFYVVFLCVFADLLFGLFKTQPFVPVSHP